MNIGDTVRLNSGSDLMTIESILEDGRLVCVWMDREKKIVRDTFPKNTLTIEDEEASIIM